MKASTKRHTNASDASYQFNAGDLIEYRHPDTGDVFTGRIVFPYQVNRIFDDDGKFLEERRGYACDYDGFNRASDDRPYFAYASGLRLRPDLAAARTDNAFQALISSILTAPRRGRRPKSPYPAAPKD